MARTIDWAVNVDKLRVCITMPENLYGYLNEHYTRYDELTSARILDEDDFSLVSVEYDETKMSAVLYVRDFMERFGERLYRESGEHSNVLNLLGMSDFSPRYVSR